MRLRANVTAGFDYIVTSQSDFNLMFTRTSAGVYRINDGIKSVYIKAGLGSGSVDAARLLDTGAYDMVQLLAGGDTASVGIQLMTNDCLLFFCEPGTQFDWDDIKCQWAIELNEFIGENCENFGDAEIPNVYDDSSDPTSSYVAPTSYAVPMISSETGSYEGGGTLRNWMFSGLGNNEGFVGGDGTGGAQPISDYMYLDNCTLRGCQSTTNMTYFTKCTGQNFISIGNGMTMAGTLTFTTFSYCKNVVNVYILNDFYATTSTATSESVWFNFCSNITNIEINRSLVSSTQALRLFYQCDRFTNISILGSVNNNVVAGQFHIMELCTFFTNFYSTSSFSQLSCTGGPGVVGFEDCDYLTQFEFRICDTAITETSTTDFIIFKNCDHLSNIAPRGGNYRGASFSGDIIFFSGCNWLSNIQILSAAHGIHDGTVEVDAFLNCTHLSNIEVNDFGDDATTTNVYGFKSCNYISVATVINSGGSSSGTIACFVSCSYISSAYSDIAWGSNANVDSSGGGYSTNQ